MNYPDNIYDHFYPERTILEARIKEALKLDNDTAGKYFLYNKWRRQVGVSWIRLNWMVYIRPSFDKLAILAIATETQENWKKHYPSNITQHVQGAFAIAAGKGRYATLEEISTISATLTPGWEDPINLILNQYNIFPLDDTNSRDGISYKLHMYGKNLNEVMIDFHNPHSKSLTKLEKALLQVATGVVKLSGGEAERQYLKGWEHYTDRRIP